MSNSNSQMFTDGFEIIRSASVGVREGRTPKSQQPVVILDIDGKHEHTFSSESRVSKALHNTTPDAIAKRMTGGDFFFHNGELVNFQYGDRKGFCHTNESIQALIENVGYTEKDINHNHRNRTQSRNVRLQAVRSDVQIEVPQYQDGGNLSSQLSFTWDPFQQYVSTAFELVRLICTNGMTGLTSFLNNKIPLVNGWEENLNIANKQIQNTVTGMLTSRMGEMAHMRASVRDCQRVVDYCRERLDGNPANHENRKALEILRNNAYIADPMFHLKQHYTDNVLQNRMVGDQYESHLNIFTLWNMLTEIATHTSAPLSGSDHAVHKHANELVFDRGIVGGLEHQRGVVKLDQTFANAEAALVGDQL